MSFDKNQYNQVNNQITPKTDNINKEKENNLLLKPIAIKQNILANNPPPNNINKYQTAHAFPPVSYFFSIKSPS